MNLEEIKARAAKATPGPWSAWSRRVTSGRPFTNDGRPYDADLVNDDGKFKSNLDALFIAHSISDIPWLIEQLEAALNDRDRWKAMFVSLKGLTDGHESIQLIQRSIQ